MSLNTTPSAETPVQALLAKYQSDPAFKAAFDAASSATAAVQVAAQYGLPVSLSDVQALGAASEDLSDALLMNVAGGEGPDPYLNFTFN
jgi:predicted ribosomally synthesized peptide with nif11-like leader